MLIVWTKTYIETKQNEKELIGPLKDYSKIELLAVSNLLPLG